jgi:branched-chain amino acid transport system permease protein
MAVMRSRLLSDDAPRSLILAFLVLAVAVGLLLVPIVFPGARSLDTAARICGFIIVVISYDILFGYTGAISLCHVTFFGIGAYSAAISLNSYGAGWLPFFLGTLGGAFTSMVVAVVVGIFSLRIRTLFFAMFTLAFAKTFEVLSSQLSSLTGGEDGMTFNPPTEISPAYELNLFGVTLNGAVLCYYMLLIAAIIAFVVILRLVNSPFGKALQAIRDNELRAAALGIPTQQYRVYAMMISAGLASIAGSLLAVWWSFVNPATTLSPNVMIDILLMAVVGGGGTIYGAVVGVTVFVIAMNYLSEGLAYLSKSIPQSPYLSEVLNPERWQLWLGLLFVLTLYYFPTGIAGHLRSKAQGRRGKIKDGVNPLPISEKIVDAR